MKLIIFVSFALITFFAVGCNLKETQSFQTEDFIMSTVITQTVYGNNAENAAIAVNSRLKSLEKIISLYVDSSDICKINANAGLSPVAVNDYTFDLLKKSLDYSKKSDGLFDITVAPLSILWGIDTSSPHIPTEEEIAAVLPLIDYKKLKLDEKEKTAFLEKKGMKIDLGGIAKGYFSDEIFSIYESHNITGAVCSVGGNIFTYKKKPNGKPFVLGIRNPLSKNPNDVIGKLESTNQSVATTGTYERYFEKDGTRYHHIFDLKTGFPSNSDLLSVTVISDDGGLTDFLSTTLFLAGAKYSAENKNHERFSIIAIDKNKNVFCSDNLKDKFVITNSDYSIFTFNSP